MNRTNPPRTPALYQVIFVVILCCLLPACPAIIIGATGGTAMAVHDRRDAKTILEDEAIEVEATDRIYGDEKLYKKVHINVTSFNHVVLLTGEVLTPQLKAHAISLVRNVKHVKHILDYVQLGALTSFSDRSNDSWITSKIKTSMITTKGISSNRVKVVTEAANVYLMGMVTANEADLAGELTRNVKGVKRVIKLFEYIEETRASVSEKPVLPQQRGTPGK